MLRLVAIVLVVVGWVCGPTCAWGATEVEAVRAAVKDLMGTFGDRYPRGGECLKRLEGLGEGKAGEDLASLRREALIANPMVSGRPVLFVVRKQYRPDHHNTATFFPAAVHEYNDGAYEGGGALKVIDFGDGGKVRALIETKTGVVRDPEVDFEGRKIVFSMRRDAKDSYHIYEIGVDGVGLRQLTGAKDVDDLDPLYLPEGDIVFTSTREPKYCACNRHIMANLFRMKGDGANIHQIGKSTLFEGHGSLMPDGRILYYRWEYVDRNFGDAQGLWTCNPDGTNHAVYWGNNTPSPGAVVDGRAIPGTSWVVCTFSSCHDRPWGAMAVIDQSRGLDGKAGVVRTWPGDAMGLVRDPGKAHDAFDLFMGVKLKYEDPWPLSEKYFLCSRMTGRGEEMGIYLVDVFGNEVLLHVEGAGCFDPMPVGKRERPGVFVQRRDFEKAEGTFYVQDVYEGTHMKGVNRGAVKWLRVVESPEKRFWTRPGWNGQGFEGPAMNWHDFGNKIILGTVPVEADGSAYFAVPAEKFVYFQLLDEKGMMVQSMRSGVIVQPGERGSCVGCHEDRRTAPKAGGVPLAVRRVASRLEGWRGEVRAFNYLGDVQPVFDRKCVNCHTYGKELNLEGDRGLAFNVSYAELWGKGMTGAVGAGPAETMQAYSWGSHRSRLVGALLKGHYEVKLNEEEMERVVTWVDLNGPYYPSYASAWPGNLYGRSPLDDGQIGRLEKLVGMKVGNPAMVSFDRPEVSLCLSKLEKGDGRYREAIGIIEAGRENLRKRPGPDAEGFVACEVDRWREEKYAKRREVEQRNREAMRSGGKVYDEGR